MGSLQIQGHMPNLNRDAKRFIQSLSPIIANEAKNYYLDGFRKGGYQTDNSLSGWAERKKADKDKRRRAILVKTGQLRNDVDIRRTTLNEIVLGTSDTSYASYLNEGTPKMVQREFLGESKKLNTKIVRLINSEFNKYFNR